MRPYRFTTPPQPLQRAKLDNLALLTTANLLPFKERYAQLANDLPRGSVLIVLPEPVQKPRKALELVAAHLKAHGYQVTTVSAKQFAEI